MNGSTKTIVFYMKSTQAACRVWRHILIIGVIICWKTDYIQVRYQKRLQPRDTGRQLQQQRGQPAGGQPQQQQPEQREQQHRLPFCEYRRDKWVLNYLRMIQLHCAGPDTVTGIWFSKIRSKTAEIPASGRFIRRRREFHFLADFSSIFNYSIAITGFLSILA